MCSHRSLRTGVVTLVLAFVLLPAAPRGDSGALGPSITGGGLVDVTDADSLDFPLAGNFAINGGLNPGGAAYGGIDFVFRGDFASYWGAVPGVTNVFTLTGEIENAITDNGYVVLSGQLTETDYAQGQGVIFVEEHVPFQITAASGSNSFVMQFCQLPPFVFDVAAGTLRVEDGTAALATTRRATAELLAAAQAKSMRCGAN